MDGMKHEISTRILSWYHQHKRDLPWRKTQDPYAIWVSEIMLQQTQVDTVIPYYLRWMKTFGSIRKLAKAPLQNVLSLWEGLGYYSRARNFQKAAQIIVKEYQGHIPSTAEGLRSLPGIGPYTANAIASIAFNADTAVVDGNVKRVLSRLFLLRDEISIFQEKAEELLILGKAGDFNQAMMELGATLCLPKKPLCLLCPVQTLCQAFRKGLTEAFPIAAKRVRPREIRTMAVLMIKEDCILIHQRPLKGLLGGLWEFPAIRVSEKAQAKTTLKRYFEEETGLVIDVVQRKGIYQHLYTHLKERLELYEVKWLKGEISKSLNSTWKWVSLSQIRAFPFTGICGKIREEILVKSKFLKDELSEKPL